MKISLMEMRLAIHQTHDCEAKDCLEVSKVQVDETGCGEAIDVYTFEIEGHPSASRCFSWGIDEDIGRIVVAAVLMTRDTNTPIDAVKYYRGRSLRRVD